jgi:lycopene beta-cyclase
MLAKQKDMTGAVLHDVFEAYATQLLEEAGFLRQLNTMLFRAAEPAERYKVLERFYRSDPA